MQQKVITKLYCRVFLRFSTNEFTSNHYLRLAYVAEVVVLS